MSYLFCPVIKLFELIPIISSFNESQLIIENKNYINGDCN